MKDYPFVDNLLFFLRKKSNINFDNLSFYQFLSLRYGLNKNVVKNLCNYSGIKKEIKLDKIKANYLCLRIRKFFLLNIVYLDKNLKEKILSDLNYRIKLRDYRGIRHINKYPARGQRTRSNAKTKKSIGLKV